MFSSWKRQPTKPNNQSPILQWDPFTEWTNKTEILSTNFDITQAHSDSNSGTTVNSLNYQLDSQTNTCNLQFTYDTENGWKSFVYTIHEPVVHYLITTSSEEETFFLIKSHKHPELKNINYLSLLSSHDLTEDSKNKRHTDLTQYVFENDTKIKHNPGLTNYTSSVVLIEVDDKECYGAIGFQWANIKDIVAVSQGDSVILNAHLLYSMFKNNVNRFQYGLKNIESLPKTLVYKTANTINMKMLPSNQYKNLLVVVGAPYYKIKHCSSFSCGVVKDKSQMSLHDIQPIGKLAEILEEENIKTLFESIYQPCDILSFRNVYDLNNILRKAGWVCGVEDEVKYVYDGGSNKISCHLKEEGSEIEKYRIVIDDDPTEDALSKALDTIVSNSAEMLQNNWCAYFTGKWNTDPLYKKVLTTYKNINLPFETMSHENEKTYAYNQTLHILTKCGIDVKRYNIIMLDSGGGSTRII